MTDRCKICDIPLNKGSSYCGFCLLICFEREEILIEKLTKLLDQVYLRTAELSAITQRLDDYPLGSYEIACAVWNWFCERRREVSFDYFHRLSVPGLEKALALISEEALSLSINQILSTETGEKAVTSFLDENHHLLRIATGYWHQGDSAHCLREFKFGEDFAADFVIVNLRSSLSPLINLVKLEPISDPVIMQKGIPSQRLQTASMEVGRWQDWINQHRGGFIAELKKRLKNALDPISLQKWNYQNEMLFQYFIFIGRRGTSENDESHVSLADESKLTISTYDAILDDAYLYDSDHFDEMQDLETKRITKRLRATGYTVKANSDEIPEEIFSLFEDRDKPKAPIERKPPLVYTFTSHLEHINVIDWSSDGRFIAIGGVGPNIYVINSKTGQREFTLIKDSESTTFSLAFSPDSARLLAAGDSDQSFLVKRFPDTPVLLYNQREYRAKIFSCVTHKIELVYTGYKCPGINSWSPDSKYIASSRGEPMHHIFVFSGEEKETENSVKIWSATDGRDVLVYKGNKDEHEQRVRVLEWSPTGEYIASGSQIIQVWEALTGQRIQSYSAHEYGCNTLSWSPDGQYIASSGPEPGHIAYRSKEIPCLHIWDTRTGDILRSYSSSKGIAKLIWSHNGKYIVFTEGEKVNILDIKTGALIFSYTGHSSDVYALALSPDGNYVASCEWFDNIVHIWRILV